MFKEILGLVSKGAVNTIKGFTFGVPIQQKQVFWLSSAFGKGLG